MNNGPLLLAGKKTLEQTSSMATCRVVARPIQALDLMRKTYQTSSLLEKRNAPTNTCQIFNATFHFRTRVSRAGAGAAAGGACLFTRRGESALTTMLILGLNSASYCTHRAATAASLATPFGGYSPFNLGSTHCLTLSSLNLGVAQVTRLCCPLGIV